MTKYQIPLTCTISTIRTVEADNLEDAIVKAYNDLPGGVMFLNHEYPDEGDWETDEQAIREYHPDEANDYFGEES